MRTKTSSSSGMNENQDFFIIRHSGNSFHIGGDNAGGTPILLLPSSTAYTSSTSWIHFAASWDLPNGAGNLYINGSDDLDTGNQILTNDTLAYSSTAWYVGRPSADSNYLNGAMQEIYFTPEYLDLSDSANLIKVYGRNSSTIPQVSDFQVGYGPQASLVTGSQPALFLSGGPGGFGLNAGYGGDFTKQSAPTFDRGPQFPLKSSKRLAREEWKECAYCGFWFPRSEVVRDRKGLWACLSGPRDYDEEDRDDAVANLRF
jgi:hypothetical protein